MGVTSYKSALWLRRIGVENSIQRVGIRGLQARVLLEAIPGLLLASKVWSILITIRSSLSLLFSEA